MVRISEPAGRTPRVLVALFKRLALLHRSWSLHCLVFPESPDGFRLAYLGEGESLAYLRNLMGVKPGDAMPERLPLSRFGSEIRSLERSGAVICLELNRLLSPLIPAGGLQVYPWVRQRVDLAGGTEYAGKRGGREGVYGRKARKYGYTYRMVNDTDELRRFYRELYLPHLRARFGDEAHARSLSELERAMESGFLLLVYRGDLCVSGAVCRRWRNELSVPAFGHLPEAVYPMRLGGLSSVYYFLFSHAEEHGIESVDLLRSRPSTADGVFRHKSRWGAVPERDPWPHTSLRFFVPEGRELPEPLSRLLVWRGGRYRELGEVGGISGP